LLREKLVEGDLLSRRRGYDKSDIAELERGLNQALVVLRLSIAVDIAGQSDHLAGVDGSGDAIGLRSKA
jgi:hypothetical protein